jgi:hypothetical protein
MNPHNIEKERDELERVVQDLRRDEGIEITYDQVYEAFKKAKEVTLSNDIWNVLENTESNEIEIGDMKSVNKIAHMYHKTNPVILAKAIKLGDYDRPLILNYEDDRYVLVAGNTRLCTAAAMGVNPKVFIARIDKDVNEASSPAQQAAIAINMKKKGIKPKQTDEQFDDPQDETIPVPELNGMGDWRKKKIETKEMTGAASAGGYSAPLFTTTKKKLEEAMEASASGQFDVPAFGTSTKGRKNPLKIDGPSSIYKGRAVKDKKFPKWGGPKSVFIKVKDKCKKFPYCNQGDINAIEVVKEDTELQEAIMNTAIKYGLPISQVEIIVLNEINKIFI